MDTREGAFKTTADHGPAIKPGKSEESALIHMVCGLIDEMLMPPPSDKPGQSEKLNPVQIGVLRAWIDQGATWPDGPIRESVQPVNFANDIRPLLQAACSTCHQGSGAKGGFAVDSLESVLKGGTAYGKVIIPGNAAKSPLLTIVSGKDEDLPAPEKHRLPPKQVQLVEKWIAQGAR
jgi:mono/diheme cytochrome c family protein